MLACCHTGMPANSVHGIGRDQTRVWHGQQIQNRLDFFQGLLSEKDFALYLGQYGKLRPVSSGKGQRYFKVKKGHLWQLYPIQRDILSPKEHEKKILSYFISAYSTYCYPGVFLIWN